MGPKPYVRLIMSACPAACLSSPVPQLAAPAIFDLALCSLAELLDHGFGAFVIAQLFATITGAPRVRYASPDRLSAERCPELSVSLEIHGDVELLQEHEPE